MVKRGTEHAAKYDPRPQGMSAWFTVITESEFASLNSDRIAFLDSFVTIQRTDSEYTVRLKGQTEMVSIVQYGLIIVWHGPDLQSPDRPVPALFTQSVGSETYTSNNVHYPDTHIMDFLENSGDVLHFYTTHKWAKAEIEYYEYHEHTMRYMLVGELRYAQSATRLDKKIAGWVLPKVPARTEVNFIGPGFVENRVTTIAGLKLNALVTITPAGDGTRIYVLINVDTSWIPSRLESVFNWASPKTIHDLLSFVFSHAVIDDLSGDYRIWSKRKFLRKPALLLPREKHVLKIREWVETFYPVGFTYPTEIPADPDEMTWQTLDNAVNIPRNKVVTYKIAGEELIAFRDADDNVVVLDAHCPHHGAHMGYDSHVEEGCVRCPFHHFYFNAQGKCRVSNPKKKGNYIKHISTKPRQHRLNGVIVEVLV
jgi:nitrite reductase/ring-hydroxylating ferredoxin subunit